jgi:2-C-methyl-D-erythritol 2,4-cyclodiphosphate synthase
MTQAAMRVGIGFDVHPFSLDGDDDHPLVLGGIRIDDGRPLVGHSDADVIAHAVIDALFGAAGLGDIGEHFPDTDPGLRGADSIVLLQRACTALEEAGWRVVNVDCSVVLEAPKLGPHRHAMQRRLTDAVDAPVTVKAKRAEGLGAIGRGEGIACQAVALIEEIEVAR